MAEATISQDEFICPVCLDLLKDPVTILCGHSYCKICITGCWDQEDQMRVYSCPQCRQTFSPRPALSKNTILTEIVEKLRTTKIPAHYARPGDVECDLCTGIKYKAVKSCLECLNSYCQNHLVQHENLFRGYNRHNLMDATGGLQKMICHSHKKLLEVFCHTDKSYICVQCMMVEHKNHNTGFAAAERIKEQTQLKERQRKIQQGIQQREKDIQGLKEIVKSQKSSAQTAVEDSERIFTELIRSIKRSCTEVTQLIRAQEMAVVSGAEGLLGRLEQEISELKRRDTEMEELLHTQDHIHFLKRFHSLSAPPKYMDMRNIPFSSLLSFDGIRQSICQLRDKLENFCKTEIKKISDRVTFTNIVPRTRNNFLQYYHRLTMDSNTMNKYLRMSEENRVITYTDIEQPYPDHQDRFDEDNFQVLCRESVCGRCYYELEWSGCYGVYISVSYKSITRKGGRKNCLFGHNDQSWSLFCTDSGYSFIHNNKQTQLPVKCRSTRIGVYVDYSAGTLSFSDTVRHIHTVQTKFTQPLYPGFYVCYGSLIKLW